MFKKILTMMGVMTLLFGCTSNPPMKIAQNFNPNAYLGEWYEIARTPNFFEKGCRCISATYTAEQNDYIGVYNQCLKDNKWSDINGYVWNVDNDPAKLRVRFFWPFYASYWVLYVDSDYQYAVVGEPSRTYLWFLARDRVLDQATIDKMKAIAQDQGYDLSDLIYPSQQNCPMRK